MFKILLAIIILLVPLSAGAGDTKEEWAAKYVATMSNAEIAATIISLWDHVPAGTWKDNARVALKAQLVDALTDQETSLTNTVMTPLSQSISDAEDADL